MKDKSDFVEEVEKDPPTNTSPDKYESSGENSVPDPSKRPRSNQKKKKKKKKLEKYKHEPLSHTGTTTGYVFGSFVRSSTEPFTGPEDDTESSEDSDFEVWKYLKEKKDKVDDNEELMDECLEYLSKMEGLTTRKEILAKDYFKSEGRRMIFLSLSDGAKRLWFDSLGEPDNLEGFDLTVWGTRGFDSST